MTRYTSPSWVCLIDEWLLDLDEMVRFCQAAVRYAALRLVDAMDELSS